MYKRTKFVIANTPPNLQKSGQRCIAECQFGKASYYYEVAHCVSTRIDSNGATCVIIRK